jgi:hypothetical protein
MFSRLLPLLAVWVSLPVFLAAQDARDVRSLRPGDLVRISFPCQGADQPLCPSATWLFERRLGDQLEVRHPGDQTIERIPLGLRTRIEVRDGTHANAGTGLLLGLLAGVGTGLVVATSCAPGEDRGLCQFGAFVVTVPAGALLGLFIGAATRSDRWRTVSGADHPALDLHAGPTGLSVGLRFRF